MEAVDNKRIETIVHLKNCVHILVAKVGLLKNQRNKEIIER